MRELLKKYIINMFILGSIIMILVNILLDFNIAKQQQKVIFDSYMFQIINILEKNKQEQLEFEKELEQEH